MDSIVAFFEKLVSEFSWRRLGLLVAILVFGVVGVWAYEAFTGHFRSARMIFAAEHIAKLADPELKKNVESDPKLKKAHEQLKSDLNRFLDESHLEVGVPEPILKAIAAAFPWFLLGIVMFIVTEREQIRGVFGGMLVVSLPFVLVGALMPTFKNVWINYIAYPFGVVLLVMFVIVLWQRVKPKTTAP